MSSWSPDPDTVDAASQTGSPGAPAAPSADLRLDQVLPAETAAGAEDVGVRKAAMGAFPMFMLAVLAGAFIAIAAAFSTTVSAGVADGVPYGFVRLVAGLAFSLGLILVVLGGAELFTGNNLLSVAWASRRISTAAVIRNWVIVYAGILVGAIATAALGGTMTTKAKEAAGARGSRRT